MILDDCIEILDDVLMMEILDEVDFLFDRLDFLFADRHLLHGHKHTIIEINTFIDQAISALANRLNYLVAFDYLVFISKIHYLL